MSNKARRVPERIQDILEAIRNAQQDMGGLTKKQFLADGKTQRAVMESIIIIGEAANNLMRLDPTIELRNPEVWQHLRDAYDMRIVLTHEYFRVDAALVWDTVRTDLPILDRFVSRLFADPPVAGNGNDSR